MASVWVCCSHTVAIRHACRPTPRDCRYNHLDPNIRKGPWSAEENAIILKAYAEMGGKWWVHRASKSG